MFVTHVLSCHSLTSLGTQSPREICTTAGGGVHTLKTTPRISRQPLLQRIPFQSPHTTGKRQRSRRSASRMTVSHAATADGGAAKLSVGVLGIGTLGLPMARRLLEAGHSVTVWNRSTHRCDSLIKEGAQLGGSPKEVVQNCDITVAVLADPAAALEVATGADGVAAGMSAGKGYMDVSTIDVETARKIGAAVREAGGQYIEAPVSGSKQPAEKGQLIFLAAGDQELFDRAAPLLEVMGKKSFFLGDVGQGAKMKLVVNMIMGSMMASFAEGLALAKSAGLEQQDLIDVTGLGAIAAPMYALKGPMMAKDDFTPAFPLKHQQKDLGLVLEMAASLQQQLPVAGAANRAYIKAMDEDLGDLDFSAVIQSLTSK